MATALSQRTPPKALRERLGLTQAQLAQRLRVSSRTISRWECGVSHVHYVYRDRMIQWIRDGGLDPLEELR